MTAPDGEVSGSLYPQSSDYRPADTSPPWNPEYTPDVLTALRRLSPQLLISPDNQKAYKKARKEAPPPTLSHPASASDIRGTAGVKKTARRRPTASARTRAGIEFSSRSLEAIIQGERDASILAPRTAKPFGRAPRTVRTALGFIASGSSVMDQDVCDAGLDFEASVTWDMSRPTEDGYGTFLDNAGLLADDINTVATAFARALDGESTTASVDYAANGSGDRPHATMPVGTGAFQAQVAPYQAVVLDGFCPGHGACPNCRNADPGVGQWRFGEVSQKMVCSACGLYERRKGIRRPPELEARKMLRLSSGGRR
ncbi:hypothetical protein C8F01DRAFT_370344 [Mycena amicta]|nr:hypothetical protein C8F01DRAFT_370344 [Mycena amicta]